LAQTPGMAKVLGAVTSGRARGILLAEYSRLFRPDRWSDMIVLQTISDHEARIYLPSGPIDLQSELGFVQATVNNLLAAMERRRIRERMDRGKEEKRRRGNHVAGGIALPFGVTYSKAEGWAYTSDAPLVRALFRRFLQGEYNLAELARDIGIPRTNVRFILSNPIYSGWRVYDHRHRKFEGRNGVWKRIPRKPEDIIRVKLSLEPLVTEEEFARVQQLLLSRPQHRSRRSNTDIFLYRGMLACECGMPVYTTSSGNGAHFYCCRTWNKDRIPAGAQRCSNGHMTVHRLEEMLDSAIAEKLTDADVLWDSIIAYLSAQGSEETGEPIDEVGLKQRVHELERKRSRILEAFFDGLLSKSERDRRLSQLDDEVATTERLLHRDRPERMDEPTEAIFDLLVQMFGAWKNVDRVGRRQILETLSPTFTVRKYGVDGVRFQLGLLDFSRTSDGHSKTTDVVTISNRWRKAGGLYVPLSA
jgi:DNA invertase Pin-like site-specific DNA recombinase